MWTSNPVPRHSARCNYSSMSKTPLFYTGKIWWMFEGVMSIEIFWCCLYCSITNLTDKMTVIIARYFSLLPDISLVFGPFYQHGFTLGRHMQLVLGPSLCMAPFGNWVFVWKPLSDCDLSPAMPHKTVHVFMRNRNNNMFSFKWHHCGMIPSMLVCSKARAPSQYKDRLIYVWRFPC